MVESMGVWWCYGSTVHYNVLLWYPSHGRPLSASAQYGYQAPHRCAYYKTRQSVFRNPETGLFSIGKRASSRKLYLPLQRIFGRISAFLKFAAPDVVERDSIYIFRK